MHLHQMQCLQLRPLWYARQQVHSQSQVYHQSEEYRRHQNVQDRWRSPRRSRHRCHQDRFQRHLLQQQAATHPCVLARHLCLAMRFSSTPSQVVVSARWGLEVALVATLPQSALGWVLVVTLSGCHTLSMQEEPTQPRRVLRQ